MVEVMQQRVEIHGAFEGKILNFYLKEYGKRVCKFMDKILRVSILLSGSSDNPYVLEILRFPLFETRLTVEPSLCVFLGSYLVLMGICETIL